MRVLGIDPGLSGGLAVVSDGPGTRILLIEAIDVPVIGEAAKERVDVAKVIEFLQRLKPDSAFIERAQAMPDQGASSGFKYGRAVGALEACVIGMQIPLTVIESSAWKKTHGLSNAGAKPNVVKENSRQRAVQLFPMAPWFPLKGHHNRAEASLIARYGMMTDRGLLNSRGLSTAAE